MVTRMMKKTVTAMALSAGLMGAGIASADSLYLDQGTFLGAAGLLNFEGFESASVGAENPNLGDFKVFGSNSADSNYRTVIREESGGGNQYLYSRRSKSVTFNFTEFSEAVNSFGVMMTGLFTNLSSAAEIVIKTDTGLVFNTGISGADGSGFDQYFGIITDAPFTKLWIFADPGSAGHGYDQVSYGVASITQIGEGGSEDLPNQGDVEVHHMPTPTAGFAGLALLGALGFRRKHRG